MQRLLSVLYVPLILGSVFQATGAIASPNPFEDGSAKTSSLTIPSGPLVLPNSDGLNFFGPGNKNADDLSENTENSDDDPDESALYNEDDEEPLNKEILNVDSPDENPLQIEDED